MKKRASLIYFLIFSCFGYSQINFNSFPENKQLIGRDLSTNKGLIKISGEVNNGPYYDIDYENWRSGEPNNAPPPENVGEMGGNTTFLQGQWNDGDSTDTKPSYVEFEGEVAVVRSENDDEQPKNIFPKGSLITLKQGERHRLIGLNDFGVVAEIWQHTDLNNPSDENDIVRIQDDYGR